MMKLHTLPPNTPCNDHQHKKMDKEQQLTHVDNALAKVRVERFHLSLKPAVMDTRHNVTTHEP